MLLIFRNHGTEWIAKKESTSLLHIVIGKLSKSRCRFVAKIDLFSVGEISAAVESYTEISVFRSFGSEMAI